MKTNCNSHFTFKIFKNTLYEPKLQTQNSSLNLREKIEYFGTMF